MSDDEVIDEQRLIDEVVPTLDQRLFGDDGVWMLEAATRRVGFVPYDRVRYHQLFALNDVMSIMRACQADSATIAVLMLRPPANPRLYQVDTKKYFSPSE